MKIKSIKELKEIENSEEITQLDLSNFQDELIDLKILNKFINLEYLNISNFEKLQNVDGLSNLTNLTKLGLSWCNSLKNIDALSNLTNLTKLDLGSCESLKNVDALSNLTNLTELNLSDCESLQNVNGLENLIQLQYLDLSWCESLQNVDVLSDLIDLTYLDLSGCSSLRNIDILSNLTNLTKLNLSDCESLQNIDGLSNLINLTELDLSYCESLQDVDGLKNLTKLTKLYLSDCESLQNVDGLSDLTNLFKLDLSDCESLQNIDGLSNLINLTELDLSYCESLQDVDGLKNLTKLTKLYLSDCESLQNVDVLSNLTNLTKLGLSWCKSLKNIDALSNLTNLTELYLDGCESLQNIYGLKNLNNLTELDISGCISIKDITLLTDCINLRNLEYEQNPLEAESILMSTAVKREDKQYIYEHKEEWIGQLTQTPDLEPFTSRLIKALSILDKKEKILEDYKKIIDILYERDDTETNTMENVFKHSLKLGFPLYKKLFERKFVDKFLEPVLLAFSQVENKAKQWAISYIEDLLQPIKNKEKKLKELAPAICLFYTSMEKAVKVKEWLERVTKFTNPLWRDRIYAAISRYYLKKEKISSAKLNFRAIKTTNIKNKIGAEFVRFLSESYPEIAGEFLDKIDNGIMQTNLAEELIQNKKFTKKADNIYRLLMILEPSKDKLAELIETLVEHHPDSEFVKDIVKEFEADNDTKLSKKITKPKTNSSNFMINVFDEFLESSLIKDYMGRRQRERFKERIKEDPSMRKTIIRMGTAYLMYKQRNFNEDDLKAILEEIVK